MTPRPRSAAGRGSAAKGAASQGSPGLDGEQGAPRVRRTVRRSAVAGALAVLAGAGLAACGGGDSTNAVRTGTTPYSQSAYRSQPETPDMPPATIPGGRPWVSTSIGATGGSTGKPAIVVHLSIVGVKTPGGTDPVYVGPSGTVGAPILFSVKAHTEVEVVVVNHDTGPHTFTAPKLGLNVAIRADSTATFRFDAPGAGTYQWYCDDPCGPWVMNHVGYMKGEVMVVS